MIFRGNVSRFSFGNLHRDEGQLTMVACILMSMVILTVAGFVTVAIDIEAADPEREPPVGPEFEQARDAFLSSLNATYSNGAMNVYDAFNSSRQLVTTAEAQYGFAFSADLTDIQEIAPDEYQLTMIISLDAEYGHVSDQEIVVLKR